MKRASFIGLLVISSSSVAMAEDTAQCIQAKENFKVVLDGQSDIRNSAGLLKSMDEVPNVVARLEERAAQLNSVVLELKKTSKAACE